MMVAGGEAKMAERNASSGIAKLEKLVGDLQEMIPMISSDLVEQLRFCAANFPSQLSPDEKFQVWRLSFTIWNSCVDVTNNHQNGQELDEDHARLRQIASDLLFLAKSIDCIASSLQKVVSFYLKTGQIWHTLKHFDEAAVCFETATELMSEAPQQPDRKSSRWMDDQELLFNVLVARSRTAWEMSQTALACSLLARARGLLLHFRNDEPRVEIAQQYFQFGLSLLRKDDGDAEAMADAIKHLEQAFEIVSKSGDGVTDSSKSQSASLKVKILRYLAAGHLRKQNFESLLKCLVVLKSAPQHASTSYFAVKAFAGLHRYNEAARELLELVRRDDATCEACMSGIEALLHDSDHLEACKRAFLTLRARYPSDKRLPLRILESMLRMPGVANVNARIEAALEIASDEHIVAAITRSDGAISMDNREHHLPDKEKECLHALLWNCGTEQFQAKQWETCIRFFETSMLYLSSDSEGKMIRAKSMRILCLCRIALFQYDRANEYVTEAEKIDSNIASGFLKTGTETEAIDQIQKLLTYADFEIDYLILASHEALTVSYTKVAIAASSKLLTFPQDKRLGGKEDVVIIRNIVTLALQSPQNHMEIVKYMKDARMRLADQGFHSFFGSGHLGTQEAQWFASTCWNQGLQSVEREEWHLAADYLSCASDFFASLPENDDTICCLQKSLLLASSSELAKPESGDESLKSAARMLEKSREVQRALASRMSITDLPDNSAEIHLNLLTFDLKGRMHDYESQLAILHHCDSVTGFKAEHFLSMANQASEMLKENTEVEMVAFRMALKFQINSVYPDYKIIAMTVRKVIGLLDQRCKDGQEVVELYKQAKEILAGLRSGEYPTEEIQWLVATAWNRAQLPVKFFRFSEAESWMALAVDLANYDPHLEKRRLSMVECLNDLRQKKASADALPIEGR